MPVADVIKKAKKKSGGCVELPADALRELKKLLEYNDRAPTRQRVTIAEALEWLRADFGVSISEQTLNRMLASKFGRTWSGGEKR